MKLLIKNIINIRKKLIIGLSLLLVLTSFLTIKSYTNRNHIIENNKVNNKRFALYKQKDDKTGYDEITSGGFPEGYELNMELSSCKDRNNTQVAVTNVLSANGNKVTVTSNKTIYCTLYFDLPVPDIEININKGSMTSSSNEYVEHMNGYKGTVSCNSNGSATWNNKYNRLEFSALSSNGTTCNINYATDSNSYPLLKDVVESQENRVTFGNEGVVDETQGIAPDYDNTTAITNLTPTYFRNTSYTSTTQTETGSFWTYNTSTGVFTSAPSAMTASGSSAYYHAYAQIKDVGNYKICYTIAQASSVNNMLYIGVGTSYKTSISASTSAAKEGCYNLGSLTTSDYINISERGYSGTSSPVITFTLQKVNQTKIANAGYRYEGQNPDNYVWFNNEMWRIIGSIPTCTNSDCSTSENLVKIIRKDSIGGIAYDAKASGYTSEWGANTLYTLLNTYYYGNTENAKTDATGTTYCRSSGSNNTKCDYSVIGMKNADYYGSMIRNVYWNTGMASRDEEASLIYISELKRQKEGYVGLMSVSDYGYASSATTRGILSAYYDEVVSLNNWLYANVYEAFSTHPSDDSTKIFFGEYGRISSTNSYFGCAIRPAVYLDSSVKVVSGDGTEANPYILTK